jgi:hypothetical protein
MDAGWEEAEEEVGLVDVWGSAIYQMVSFISLQRSLSERNHYLCELLFQLLCPINPPSIMPSSPSLDHISSLFLRGEQPCRALCTAFSALQHIPFYRLQSRFKGNDRQRRNATG